MRLLIDDVLMTAPFAHPLTAGWVELEVTAEARAGLRAADVGAGDVALVAAAEAGLLAETHRVAPDAAVVAGAAGAVALRTPVRPDEVERTPVRLWGTSGTAELLARATLRPFYGIEPTAWTGEDAPEAQAVVVEGAEALQAPEAGFAEDLVRAWTILTGEPAVSHVLVTPAGLGREELAAPLAAVAALRAAGHERRRDLRRAVAEAHGLDRERLADVLGQARYELGEGDLRALLLLFARGARGSAYPVVGHLTVLERAAG